MKSSTGWSVLRVFWQHVCRYAWTTGIIVFAIIAAKVIEIFAPLYYKRFFDVLATNAPGAQTASELVGILLIIMGIHGGGWLCWRVSGILTDWFQPRVMADLENTAFRHLIRHSYTFFTNAFAGSLVRRVNRLSGAFENVADQIQWQMLPLLVSIVGSLIVLGTRSIWLAIALFVWIVIFLYANYRFNRWKVRYEIARADKDSQSSGTLADAVSNSMNVKLFTAYVEEENRFGKVTDELRRLRQWTFQLTEINIAVQGALMIAIEFILLFVAVDLWKQGIITIGDFALIQGYLIALFGKLWEFGHVIRRLYQSIADAKEMVDILEQPHEVEDAKGAKMLSVTKGEIEFAGVSFNYHKTRSVLEHFSLSIAPHEKVALVGPSGAGKSTVVKLLFRFFDVNRGRVLIDGQNIARVTQESLWGAVSLVPQDPVLFHRSLMDNIRYGRREATDEEVIKAAKQAHCHEFIKDLPSGYETFVGERGVKLSGGERQRVAIARAILKNAPILVLDEATSSLDSESEALIQDALRRLMKNKTAIVIAHRLSTIMQMDRIVVMESGRIMDSGTHAALIKKKGLYQKLWQIQAGGFLQS